MSLSKADLVIDSIYVFSPNGNTYRLIDYRDDHVLLTGVNTYKSGSVPMDKFLMVYQHYTPPFEDIAT